VKARFAGAGAGACFRKDRKGKKRGVIPIENEKRINWGVLRAEYIGGGTSYRKLAEKYGTNKDVVARRAKAENWEKARAAARDEAATKSIQKAADAVAENATIAADIKKRLLLRLQRIEENYPMDATEIRTRSGGSYVIYRIKDLTSAYKDLVDDATNGSENNSPVMELLRRLDGECGV
jgi:hypothetical protein